MASRLGVSVSSYYDYRTCKHTKREIHKIVLSEKIRYHFGQSYELYGSRRLSGELKNNGIRASHTTIAKYMRQMGLRSKFYRKFRVTTDSRHNNPVAENLLDRDFTVLEPDKVWVSDITYISVVGGFEYLTTIIDLFGRKVVGYSQSKTLKAADTVIPALNMAIKRRLNGRQAPGLVFHSDRGVQYTCSEFTKLLDKAGITRSNSRKGNCWDNAVAASFFKTLKCELVYRFKQLLTASEMKTEIFRYIECWYNKKRRHSTLGYITIDEFYNKYNKPNNLLIAS
jgi:transposase InsO family protein